MAASFGTRMKKKVFSVSGRRAIVALVVFVLLWELGSRSKQWLGIELPWVGKVPAPSAVLRVWAGLLDDGELDVLMSGDTSKLNFLRSLPKVFKGTHLDSPHAHVLRGRVIEVSSDRPFVIYADGDPIGATPATVTVEPRCLRVIVPPAAP